MINSISSLSPQGMKNEAESSMFPIKAWSFLRLAPILAQALWGTAKSHLIGTKDTPIIRYHSGNSKQHISSMPETGTKTNYFSMIPHHLSLTVDSNVYVIYSRVQATIRCGFTCENPIEFGLALFPPRDFFWFSKHYRVLPMREPLFLELRFPGYLGLV